MAEEIPLFELNCSLHGVSPLSVYIVCPHMLNATGYIFTRRQADITRSIQIMARSSEPTFVDNRVEAGLEYLYHVLGVDGDYTVGRTDWAPVTLPARTRTGQVRRPPPRNMEDTVERLRAVGQAARATGQAFGAMANSVTVFDGATAANTNEFVLDEPTQRVTYERLRASAALIAPEQQSQNQATKPAKAKPRKKPSHNRKVLW